MQSVPMAGGPRTVLSSPPAGPLSVDSTRVYFVANGSILQMAHAGGTVTTLATGQATPSSIAVDDTNVYWATRYGINQSSVQSVPIGGGPIATLATGQGNTNAIAVDANNVYWVSTTAGGSVLRLSK